MGLVTDDYSKCTPKLAYTPGNNTRMGEKCNNKPPPVKAAKHCLRPNPSQLTSAIMAPNSSKILAGIWFSTYWPLLYKIGAGQSKKSDSTVLGLSSEKQKSHEVTTLCSSGKELPCEGAVRSLCSHAPYCSVPAGTGSKAGPR